jgi:hypothetical protein
VSAAGPLCRRVSPPCRGIAPALAITAIAAIAALATVTALVALAPPAALAAPGLEVEARVAPQVIGIDETAQLTLEVRTEGWGEVRFRPSFELDNLEIVGGPFAVDDRRFLNGERSRSLRLTWELRPLGPGPARVRALKVLVRGTVLDLAGAEIAVREEPPGAGAYSPDGRDPHQLLKRFLDRSTWRRLFAPHPTGPRVFLRAEVTPERPYVGEQALYTVYLYTLDDVNTINQRSVPPFEGFWVRDVPPPERSRVQMVEVDGEPFGRVPLLRKALFPGRPGTHEIEPTEMDLMVSENHGRYYLGSEREVREVEAQSQPLHLNVRPLPPVPAGLRERFDGQSGTLVGRDLVLHAELEPATLRLGEASTLTLSLTGEGHLQGVAQPVIADPAGLKLLLAEQRSDEELAGETVMGRSSWSFAVVPERTGTFDLRVPEILYFDPVAGSYRVTQAPPLQLAVRGRAPAAGERPGQLHGIRSAAVQPRRPWAGALSWAFALPWGIALGLVLLRRLGPAKATGLSPLPAPPDAPAGAAPAGCEARLREALRAAAAEARPRQAAAAVEEAWRTFLADCWKVPRATPAGRWPGALQAGSAGRLSEAVMRELAQLADDLHYLRSAPELSATGPLRDEALARSHRLLRQLRRP